MILRILPVLLLILLLPPLGIERLMLREKSWRKWIYAPNLLLALLLIGASVKESYSMTADQLKAILLSTTLCVAVPEIILSLLLLFCLLFKSYRLWVRRIALFVSSVVFLTMLYGFTLGYRQIVVKPFTYTSAAIPQAFDGYRIVQLSDLHVGTLRRHHVVVERIVDSVNALQPDLIVFTGDLVNYHAEELFEFEDIFRKMHARDGVVSIMGNHDYMTYYNWPDEKARLANVRLLQDHQRAIGWRLLLNDNYILRRGNDSIAIVGVENDGKPPFPALGDLPRAQRGLQNSCFQILLSHDPTHWRRRVLPETRIPLMLAGHTHGMQLKIGSFSPSEWFYPEWGGPYYEGGHTLYVSLGVGEVLLPFRIGAWPEINLITLKHH